MLRHCRHWYTFSWQYRQIPCFPVTTRLQRGHCRISELRAWRLVWKSTNSIRRALPTTGTSKATVTSVWHGSRRASAICVHCSGFPNTLESSSTCQEQAWTRTVFALFVFLGSFRTTVKESTVCWLVSRM